MEPERSPQGRSLLCRRTMQILATIQSLGPKSKRESAAKRAHQLNAGDELASMVSGLGPRLAWLGSARCVICKCDGASEAFLRDRQANEGSSRLGQACQKSDFQIFAPPLASERALAGRTEWQGEQCSAAMQMRLAWRVMGASCTRFSFGLSSNSNSSSLARSLRHQPEWSLTFLGSLRNSSEPIEPLWRD